MRNKSAADFRLMLDCIFGFCLLIAAFTSLAEVISPEIEERYQSALTFYKNGKCQSALPLIGELNKLYPEVKRFNYDFIAISVGCSRYDEVQKYINRNFLDVAPPYVKDALLEASIKKNELSVALLVQEYDEKRSLQLLSIAINRIYELLENKDYIGANNLSQKIVTIFPGELSSWDTRAYVLREQGELLGALQIYLYIEKNFPNNNDASLATLNILLGLGMPQTADDWVRTHHIALTPNKVLELKVEIAIRQLRWANTYEHDKFMRKSYINKAIAGLKDAREYAISNKLGEQEILGINFNLLTAYAAAYQYSDAIQLYEKFEKNGDVIPDYVTLATAESYEQLRKYPFAEALYLKLLSNDPENIDLKINLYYSLINQDKFKEADLVIKDLLSSLKSQLETANRRAYYPGEYRGFIESLRERLTSVKIAEVSSLSYQDRLEEANRAINQILDEAPSSNEALVAKGNIENWMGNPRDAQDFFKIAENASPDNIDAKIGMSNAQLEQQNYKSSKEILKELKQDYPERPDVQELERKISLRQSPMVTGDFEISNGKASAQDLSAATADMRVYSESIDDNYRLYGRFRGLYSGPAVQSNISAGTLGARYDGTGHEVSAEVGDRGYAKLEGIKYLNDAFSGSLAYEKNAFYLLPGSLYPTYTGNVIGGKLNWKNDDVQKAAIGYQYWALSNNYQTQSFASFSQRLMTEYDYRLEGSIWIGNQQNTNPRVGYFAPSNQTEYSGTLSLELLQWRDVSDKQYSFWHKFWGSYGMVTQQGFITLPMNNVGYGQNFNIGSKQRISWGIGKTYFPFDGVRSSYVTGYLRFEQNF